MDGILIGIVIGIALMVVLAAVLVVLDSRVKVREPESPAWTPEDEEAVAADFQTVGDDLRTAMGLPSVTGRR